MPGATIVGLMTTSSLRSAIGIGLLSLALLGACGSGTTTETAPTTSALNTPTTLSSTTAPATSTNPEVGTQVDVAWPHTWTDSLVGGGQFDAGDYAGQDLVLWFWAPW